MADVQNGAEHPLPAGGDFKMPPMEKLLAAIENMKDLPEESKKELREGIMKRAESGLGLDEFDPAEFVNNPKIQAAAKDTSLEFMILFGLITLVFLIIVFFGYKLYKSLVERERRREEKRKLKLQKKKK